MEEQVAEQGPGMQEQKNQPLSAFPHGVTTEGVLDPPGQYSLSALLARIRRRYLPYSSPTQRTSSIWQMSCKTSTPLLGP